MSGSRLGRGRGGRLVLFGCSALGVVFLMFLYRSTSSEMARLRDLHVKCAQQQEALAAQLQVIYEYKLQLEKTLSNEKSANAAAKEELQKKASREKSLRDKDITDAMQRLKSIQQSKKLLESEHQDLKDDCKKKEAVALETGKRLESTLKDLRIQLKKAEENKEKAMEHLKTKYIELITQKEQLEENYKNLKKMTDDNNGNVEHLQKQVIQLQRELNGAKKSPHFSIGGVKNTQMLPSLKADSNKSPRLENNQGQVMRPSSQLQVSPSSEAFQVGQNPQPLQAPENSRDFEAGESLFNVSNSIKGIGGSLGKGVGYARPSSNNTYKFDDFLPNEPKSDVRFDSRNGNIVPVGPSDVRDQYPGMARAQEHQEEANANEISQEAQEEADEQPKQVLAPPNAVEKFPEDGPANAKARGGLSSKGPMMIPILKPQAGGQSADIDDQRDLDGYSNDFV